MDILSSDTYLAENPAIPFSLNEQWMIRDDSSYGKLLAFARQPAFSVSREIVVISDDGSGKQYFKVSGKFLHYEVKDAEGETVGLLRQQFALGKTMWQALNQSGEVVARMVLDHIQSFKDNLARETWVTTVQEYLVYCGDTLKGKIMVRNSPTGKKCAADFSPDRDKSLDRRLALGLMLVA